MSYCKNMKPSLHWVWQLLVLVDAKSTMDTAGRKPRTGSLSVPARYNINPFRCLLACSFLVASVWYKTEILEIYRMSKLRAANVHKASRLTAYTAAKVSPVQTLICNLVGNIVPCLHVLMYSVSTNIVSWSIFLALFVFHNWFKTGICGWGNDRNSPYL